MARRRQLGRIALYLGTVIEHPHLWSWLGLDVSVLKAAAVELASIDLGNPAGPGS